MYKNFKYTKLQTRISFRQIELFNYKLNDLEMEPLDKKRATEVNEMCEKSEELLTQTIKKRKTYPQKIKDRLRMKHEAELINLVCMLVQVKSLSYRTKDQIFSYN